MKVNRYINLTGAGGALIKAVIRMNDVVSPWAGATTGQPLYLDQAAALYKQAIVIGCKVHVKFHNSSAIAGIVGISKMPEDNATTPTTYEHYQEMFPTVSRLLSPDVDHGILSMKASIKKHFGVKNLTDSEDFSSIITNSSDTSPTRTAEFHVWAQDMGSTAEIIVQATAVVEYIVLLRQRIIPARSTTTT